MKAHVLQHAAFEELSYVETWLTARSATIGWTRFYESPALPPGPDGIDLIIAMGGPMSVNDEAELPWLIDEKRFLREALQRGVPVLGICLGAQLIASALGARVYRNHQKEIGWFPVERIPAGDDVFQMPERLETLHWHGETFDLPPGAVRLARSATTANQAFQVGRRALGIQFHPEVTPEVARAFADSSDEPESGPFVQTASAICSAPASVYARQNACLAWMLEYLTAP